jgi:hypothetical protein
VIISDELRFAFIHVPKCAGSSIRLHLKASAIDSYKGAFGDKGFHEQLGCVIHYAHIPLIYLREHFRDAFDKVDQYSSYAIVRDPRARFVSAVLQRMREFKEIPHSRISRKVIVANALEAVDWLSQRRFFADLEYIHFAPQSWFLALDGRQIVKNLFSIDRADELARVLALRYGITVVNPGTRKNVSRIVGSPLLRRMQAALMPIYRPLLSERASKSAVRAMIALKVLVPAEKLYDAVLQDKDIAAFVASYYADDFALVRSAELQRNAEERPSTPVALHSRSSGETSQRLTL